MPNPAIFPTFLRESLGARTLSRVPEPDSVMDGDSQVADYAEGGRTPGVMAAAYLFHTARISQVVAGCRRVLDLGCGPATQLVQAARLNPEISFVGMDLSGTMLDAAKAHAKAEGCANVEFQRGDITRLDGFEDNAFDGVISTMALHHLPTIDHLSACMKEIDRVLRPGGALYLVDFGLLKSLKSIMFFVNENRPHQPPLFSLDFELSLKAAFLAEELRGLARDLLPEEMQFYSTFQIPLLNVIKSVDRPLAPETHLRLREMRAALPRVFRGQLDDIRTFFWFGGLRNDPFRRRARLADKV